MKRFFTLLLFFGMTAWAIDKTPECSQSKTGEKANCLKRQDPLSAEAIKEIRLIEKILHKQLQGGEGRRDLSEEEDEENEE